MFFLEKYLLAALQYPHLEVVNIDHHQSGDEKKLRPLGLVPEKTPDFLDGKCPDWSGKELQPPFAGRPDSEKSRRRCLGF